MGWRQPGFSSLQAPAGGPEDFTGPASGWSFALWNHSRPLNFNRREFLARDHFGEVKNVAIKKKQAFPLLNTEEAEEIVSELGRALDAHRDWTGKFRTMLVCRTKPKADDLDDQSPKRTVFGRWYFGKVNPHLHDAPSSVASPCPLGGCPRHRPGPDGPDPGPRTGRADLPTRRQPEAASVLPGFGRFVTSTAAISPRIPNPQPRSSQVRRRT